VEHGEAYFENMEGRHGKQLSLAYNCVDTKKRDRYLPDDLLDLFENDNDVDESSQAEEGALTVGFSTNHSSKGTHPSNFSDTYEEMSEEEQEDYPTNDDDDDDKSNNPQPRYNNDGSVIYDDPSELLAYKAGAPAGGIFAIIQLAGASQHKVAVDDVVIVNKLLPLSKWKVGETITLQGESEVLLIGSQERTVVGLAPGIPNATVKVMVEEITHDANIIVFKKKRRKNYRRKKGFRREVTMLRVLNIEMPPELMNTKGTTTTSISRFNNSNNADGNEQKSLYAA
jgi:large subunit ribosomal protein L21